MQIINDSVLDLFRVGPVCEFCGVACARSEAHHVFSRGSGRLDVRWLTVGLCLPFTGNGCHFKNHNGGEPTQSQLLRIVAKREQTTTDAIIDARNAILRLDKDASPDRITAFLLTLPSDVAVLVRIALESVGRLP